MVMDDWRTHCGYGAVWRGQKAWNGVAILARGAEPVPEREGASWKGDGACWLPDFGGLPGWLDGGVHRATALLAFSFAPSAAIL
jgi:hypothetical protein